MGHKEARIDGVAVAKEVWEKWSSCVGVLWKGKIFPKWDSFDTATSHVLCSGFATDSCPLFWCVVSKRPGGLGWACLFGGFFLWEWSSWVWNNKGAVCYSGQQDLGPLFTELPGADRHGISPVAWKSTVRQQVGFWWYQFWKSFTTLVCICAIPVSWCILALYL